MTVCFDAAEEFNAAFDAELAGYPPGTPFAISGRPSKAHPHGEDERWWRENGPQMVENWVKWRDATPWTIWTTPDGRPAIELELEVRIGGMQLPTKLFIDRVFETSTSLAERLGIVDVKSGGQPPAGHVQLGIYKAAIEQAWPDTHIAWGAYWMARKGELTPTINLDHFAPRYLATLMERTLTAREHGIFIPRQSGLCRSCKVGRYCAINDGAEAHLDPDYELMRNQTEGSHIG